MVNRVRADRQSDDVELVEILNLFPEKNVLFPKAIVDTSVTPYFHLHHIEIVLWTEKNSTR